MITVTMLLEVKDIHVDLFGQFCHQMFEAGVDGLPTFMTGKTKVMFEREGKTHQDVDAAVAETQIEIEDARVKAIALGPLAAPQ